MADYSVRHITEASGEPSITFRDIGRLVFEQQMRGLIPRVLPWRKPTITVSTSIH